MNTRAGRAAPIIPDTRRPNLSCEQGHFHIWASDGQRYTIITGKWTSTELKVTDVNEVRFCAVCGSLLRMREP